MAGEFRLISLLLPLIMKEMNIFCEKVAQTIREHRLLSPEDKILVALSGGADSVALLSVLSGLGYRCEAVHCNFRLRGEESDRDEDFVRSLCRKRKILLHVKAFDTVAYAERKGISIEMAARELRYDYFETLRTDWRYDKIAVAHHRNDNAETLMLNLIRGTGLKGLTGIHYRNGFIVRPLLDTGREEIEAYLSGEGQAFVTDTTNLEPDVVRNRIRLNILPQMQDINPSLMVTMQDTLNRMNDAYALYQSAVEAAKNRVVKGRRIDMEALKLVPAPRTVLYEVLSEYGFNPSQVTEIYDQMAGEPGKVYESGEWRLLRDRGAFELRHKGERCKCLCHVLPLDGYVEVTSEWAFSIRRVRCDSCFEIPKTKDTVCLALDKIEYPITVRLAEEGDRFIPFGMEGSKLISDYLTDAKRTLFEKECQLVVCSGEQVAWLVNERPDNRFRVDESTSYALVIQAVRL